VNLVTVKDMRLCLVTVTSGKTICSGAKQGGMGVNHLKQTSKYVAFISID